MDPLNPKKLKKLWIEVLNRSELKFYMVNTCFGTPCIGLDLSLTSLLVFCQYIVT